MIIDYKFHFVRNKQEKVDFIIRLYSGSIINEEYIRDTLICSKKISSDDNLDENDIRIISNDILIEYTEYEKLTNQINDESDNSRLAQLSFSVENI